MRILIAGEDREGALLRSLASGLRLHSHDVITADLAPRLTDSVDRSTLAARLSRVFGVRQVGAALEEAVDQLRPEVTLLIKGRGVSAESVNRARRSTKIAIYYPDNPYWARGDTRDALKRLAAADLAVIWTERLADRLRPSCRHVEVVPFGYDESWFPVADPAAPRTGVVFVGTWHPRRERFLSTLSDLPLTVVGSGWARSLQVRASAPTYGPGAGALLRQAAVGINILHPQNAGAHNMRTREIAASGALQLTDPGTDGTPLRDGDGCRWFHSPEHLRQLVLHYLSDQTDAIQIAMRGQTVLRQESYSLRAKQLADLFIRLG